MRCAECRRLTRLERDALGLFPDLRLLHEIAIEKWDADLIRDAKRAIGRLEASVEEHRLPAAQHRAAHADKKRRQLLDDSMGPPNGRWRPCSPKSVALLPLPLQPFRSYQQGERTVHLNDCVGVEAAYYGAPPGWIGRRVQVDWNGRVVHLLDPRSGQKNKARRLSIASHRSLECSIQLSREEKILHA